ncbi:MAG: hypothetical protein E7Z73_03950 [Methanobrevibacter millerae]|uniref:Uncharacterized protein n=1 Tax=Methanobrevibacter millerae TaxID=230361 RepID=A0A8T3VA04_9EURY|nr:hypothetical protein [Methanobrevibacter millerae]MBE6504888.1 hypothetical protein [Methanobrevibacter millerae]
MSDDNKINVNDINYAVYKLGNWKNEYEINQIGLSKEIPVTKPTITHIKFSMEEIRKSQFDISNKTVNGFVAIAFQLNPKIQEMDLEDVIELEQKEFDNIIDELDNLELLDENSTIDLDDENYLIYKLEKECHVTTSIPANEHTKKYYEDEMKRIDDAVLN